MREHDTDRIAAVRRFTRLYTGRLGVLRERLLDGPFSLTEARVIYEMATRERATAGDIARDLGLDPSFLSRTLKSLGNRGFVTRQRSTRDAREYLLSLTPAGIDGFALIDARSREQVATLLGTLDEPQQRRLVGAMNTIESLLDTTQRDATPCALRSHRPGDIGWVIARHGALYHEEYGWDESFEALVAEIAAQFLRHFDATRECCWIAERGTVNVGSAFVMRDSDAVAKLRLVIVEPSARGFGIGQRLVDRCITFARDAGYRTLTLWTNDVLVAARHIYEKAGFVLAREEPHHSFGKDLVGQNWDLTL